ncbi:MAG: hypothetical protein P4L46_19640 [Fimbriimonas sp.]|nr:hypothetical protein [Fimbriimonas sp.]
MNRVLWSGLIVMATSVLLYLGYLVTTIARPMLTGVAAIGGLLFVAGCVLSFRNRGNAKQPQMGIDAPHAEPKAPRGRRKQRPSEES